MYKLEEGFNLSRRSYDLVTLYNLFNTLHSTQSKNKNYTQHSPEFVITKLASFIHLNNPDADIIERVEGMIEQLRQIKAGKLHGITDPILVVPYIDWDTVWDEETEAA